MSAIDSRRAQRLPTLSDVQIDLARRFARGEPRAFAPGETLFDLGAWHVAAWMVLEGGLSIIRRAQPGEEATIAVLARPVQR